GWHAARHRAGRPVGRAGGHDGGGRQLQCRLARRPSGRPRCRRRCRAGQPPRRRRHRAQGGRYPHRRHADAAAPVQGGIVTRATRQPGQPLTIETIIASTRIIPVLSIDRLEDAVPLAEALLAGGLPVLEVTLRTEAALPAIEAIARSVPEMTVGAGTILTPQDLREARRAGARFGVSPG